MKGGYFMPKKGENIYKRKDGRWEGRYIKARTNEGKIIYGYVYSRTYRETKIKLKEKVQPLMYDLAKTNSIIFYPCFRMV